MKPSHTNSVKVSVLCFAYNHAQYIRQALDSVLRQETDFEFEVIVHDDASTDGTTEIICEFKQKYDNLHAVIETNNKFENSKEFEKSFAYLLRGEYLAFLECDDYWTDKFKLQKQVDYLDNHPDVPAVGHHTEVINMQTGEHPAFFAKREKDIGLMTVASGWGAHINSILMRTVIYQEYENVVINRLNPNGKYYSGDAVINCMICLHGNIHYLPDTMSVYRFKSGGDSISSTLGDARSEGIMKNFELASDAYRLLDEYSNHKYHKTFEHALMIKRYWANGNKIYKGDLTHDKYLRGYFLWHMSIMSKLHIIGTLYFPKFYRVYEKIKESLAK